MTATVLLIQAMILECITFGYFLAFGRKTKVLYSFLIMHLLMMIWITAFIVEKNTNTIEIQWIAVCIAYTAICFMGVSWLNFTIHYIGKGWQTYRKIIISGLAISSIGLIGVIVNPFYPFFIENFHTPSQKFGIMYWVIFIQSHGCIIWGTLLLFQHTRKISGKEKYQTIFLACIPIFSLSYNAMYNGGWFRTSFDLTPIIFSVLMSIFSILSFKYKFFDYLPMGIQMAFSTLHIPSILVNQKEEIIQANRSFSRQFMKNNPLTVRDLLSDLEPIVTEKEEFQRLETHIFQLRSQEYSQRLTVRSDKITQIYFVKITPINEKDRVVLKLISFTDITDYIRMTQTKERNAMAREIHDSLGHALTIILKLQEGALHQSENPEQVRSLIQKSEEFTKRALQELRLFLYKTKEEEDVYNLVLRLRRLQKDFESLGIEVRIHQQIVAEKIGQDLSTALYKIIKEAITNAIKHGKANEIDLIIKESDGTLEMYVIDNGIGNIQFVEGYGMTGIKQRLLPFCGEVAFQSDGESGFIVKVKIPQWK